MTNPEIQKLEGKLEELKARAAQEAASLEGDRKGQVRGKAKEIKGKAKQAVATTREKLSEGREKVAEKLPSLKSDA